MVQIRALFFIVIIKILPYSYWRLVELEHGPKAAHGNWRISRPRAGQWVLVIHIKREHLEEILGGVCLLMVPWQEKTPYIVINLLTYTSEGFIHLRFEENMVPSFSNFRKLFCLLPLPEILRSYGWFRFFFSFSSFSLGYGSVDSIQAEVMFFELNRSPSTMHACVEGKIRENLVEKFDTISSLEKESLALISDACFHLTGLSMFYYSYYRVITISVLL